MLYFSSLVSSSMACVMYCIIAYCSSLSRRSVSSLFFLDLHVSVSAASGMLQTALCPGGSHGALLSAPFAAASCRALSTCESSIWWCERALSSSRAARALCFISRSARNFCTVLLCAEASSSSSFLSRSASSRCCSSCSSGVSTERLFRLLPLSRLVATRGSPSSLSTGTQWRTYVTKNLGSRGIALLSLDRTATFTSWHRMSDHLFFRKLVFHTSWGSSPSLGTVARYTHQVA
mmetsp:Transcript_33230/g.94941  ORF Transcript_33230/g.94941 Transcript_33230/m.94941 type:complete len:234 (+) Transcript_33230:8587-9288(+)